MQKIFIIITLISIFLFPSICEQVLLYQEKNSLNLGLSRLCSSNWMTTWRTMLGKWWLQTSLQIHTFLFRAPKYRKSFISPWSWVPPSHFPHRLHWNMFCTETSFVKASLLRNKWLVEGGLGDLCPTAGCLQDHPHISVSSLPSDGGKQGTEAGEKNHRSRSGTSRSTVSRHRFDPWGNSKSHVSLETEKKKAGSTWKITTHSGDSMDPEKHLELEAGGQCPSTEPEGPPQAAPGRDKTHPHISRAWG